jgi:uncharacterized protein YaaR (DUF327 family)
MKINRDLHLVQDKKQLEPPISVKSSEPFHSLVQKQQNKLQDQHIQRLLTEIGNQGQRLVKSQTMKDLRVYKQLVKRFVKEAVDYGMNLKQSRNWTSQGQSKTYRLVEEVDKRLVELTESMLTKEGKSIDLLQKIGEIKGLLINLYT